MGGLCLIHYKFFPWAQQLLKFIVHGYDSQELLKDLNTYISNQLSKLRTDKTMITEFKLIAESQGIAVDDNVIDKAHLRIAEFTFRAYSKKEPTRRSIQSRNWPVTTET